MEKVKKLLNEDYSDKDTDSALEVRIAVCAQSLILGGTPLSDITECLPIIVETIRIMVIDLSEETPGYTKFSSAAQFLALQTQLGVNGNG